VFGSGAPGPGMPLHSSDSGASLADLLVALGLLVAMGSLSMPVTARAVEAGRVRHAAGFLAEQFREARQRAVFDGRTTGVVFDHTAGGWTFRACVDGNGNGLRRADVDAGVDPCHGRATVLGDMYPGVLIAVDPLLRGPGGEPGSPDPVRFGVSEIVSFSAEGHATPGTVFVRSPTGLQFCVRIGGVGGRTRLLQYDTGTRTWRP
jgi:hypothetical protein